MEFDPGGWFYLVAAAITIAGSYAAARYAGKASIKVKELDVGQLAYATAQKITSELIDNLRTELDRAKKQIQELQETLRTSQAESMQLRSQVTHLESTIDRMQTQIDGTVKGGG